MGKTPNYFIVEAGALPEIFLKVAEAKRMLETGEVDTVNMATRRAGISRSAFYKYKDAVRPFNDMLHGRIITFQMLLKDEPGVLSAVLNIFAQSGGNILTINQGIPVNGCAAVSIGAETSGLELSLEEFLHRTLAVEGVVRSEILAG
ncbi:ACT domain-containing protein [Pseudoflavonifractor sp. 524-17]|uniref:ACT domain-containing protein n=1 Tax=Pseudoflavonifractor sp. 524-17 TaxID=2304577 RepID=UPI001379BA7C|nr:ACT domain-containing protein [Pseudoflavonifractor sp. 524-17]